MDSVIINNTKEEESRWVFEVSVSDKIFKVSLPKDYYQELTDGNTSAKNLIERSFKFLLSKEPLETILTEFELPVINRYFSGYEDRMKSEFKNGSIS